MAAPTWVASTGSQSSTSITSDSNYSAASTQLDDIIIQQATFSGTSADGTPPGDWTVASNIAHSSTQRKITIWKRAAANEATPVWSAISGSRFFQTSKYRGCVTTGTPYETLIADSKASSTAVSVALGNTTYSDVLWAFMMVNFSGGTVATWTDVNLASLTERYDVASGSLTPKTVTGTLVTAGDGGTITATLSSAGVQVWTAFSLLSTTSTSSTTRKSDFFQFF